MKAGMDGYEAGQIDAAPKRRRARRFSELFSQIARDAQGAVSIGTIRDSMGDRSFAALLVFFAFINMIPLPPPSSAILGLPMMIVAAQLAYGAKRAWLPEIVTRRSLTAAQFRTAMDRLIPRLLRLEQWVRPRYWPFWRRRGDRVVGFIALFLSLIVVLPIPLGNWLPSFATALLGLSLSERDGLLFVVGCGVAAAGVSVIVFVVGAAGFATHAVWGWMM